MHKEEKQESRGLQMIAVGLGAVIVASLSFNPGVSSFRNHAPTLVFASSIDSNCQVILDANNKLIHTPYHAYTTASGALSGGPPMKIEAISIDGTMYSGVNGEWTASPLSMQDFKDMEKGNQDASQKTTCQHLRDESVNGESAAVYSSHSESERGKNSQVMWISRSRGLILRLEGDEVIPDGAKAHISTRYEYSNVQKPKL